MHGWTLYNFINFVENPQENMKFLLVTNFRISPLTFPVSSRTGLILQISHIQQIQVTDVIVQVTIFCF